MPPGREDRPHVVVAEQPVGRLLHEGDVLHVGPDAAQDAEHRLHQEGRLYQPRIDEMGQIVQVADVVALVFEAGAAPLT